MAFVIKTELTQNVLLSNATYWLPFKSRLQQMECLESHYVVSVESIVSFLGRAGMRVGSDQVEPLY